MKYKYIGVIALIGSYLDCAISDYESGRADEKVITIINDCLECLELIDYGRLSVDIYANKWKNAKEKREKQNEEK